MGYLETEKAILHTETLRRGSGFNELGAYLIAAARLAQSRAQYEHAQDLLTAAAAVYAAGSRIRGYEAA